MPKYDEGLAQRVRERLDGDYRVVEKAMFGGLCFMVNGHMCVGVETDRLMVRCGKARYDEAMARPHAAPMDFTKRVMKGFVFVGEAGVAADHDLSSWVQLGLEHALSLPPK